MADFNIHTSESAPDASRAVLENTQKKLGFVPNLYAVMAESPATLAANMALTKHFDQTDFSPTERQLVLLSISRIRNCAYCLAAHSSIAKMQGIDDEIIAAVYFDQPLEDPKLRALRDFTRAVLNAQGWIVPADLQAFYQAGYQRQHVLEIILAISFKTLSNFINHIVDTPIDPQFVNGIPESVESQVAH